MVEQEEQKLVAFKSPYRDEAAPSKAVVMRTPSISF